MILQWFSLVFGWASIVIFVVIAAYRLARYAAMPLNLRWEVYPVPHETKEARRYGGSYMEQVDWAQKGHPSSLIGELLEMAAEILTLKRIREHNPYNLWPWSLALHWGAYLGVLWIVILAASLLFPGVAPALAIVGVLSFAAGIIGAVGLFVKRTAIPSLRLYTSPVDLFNLVFITILFSLGLASWIGDPLFAGHRLYAGSLVSFRPAQASPLVLAFFFVLQLFAIYMPSSKLIHPLIKHFTFTKILWDDTFKAKGSGVDRQITRQLDYPVTWSAPHIQGAETWKGGVRMAAGEEEK